MTLHLKQGGGCRLVEPQTVAVLTHLPLVARDVEPGRREHDGLEHQLDRAIISAVHRAERAKAGRGYQFEIPPKARQ